MMCDAIDMDCNQPLVVYDAAGDLIFHPAPRPSLRTDEDANDRASFHSLANEPLDRFDPVELSLLPKAAVVKSEVDRPVELERIADIVDTKAVGEVEAKKCDALLR